MSVPGFVAARGGDNTGFNRGYSSWLPALTILRPELFVNVGQSRSYRGGFEDINVSVSHDVIVYRKPASVINRKLMTFAYYLGHQAGPIADDIKGVVIFYWSINSAGALVFESVDTTLLTNALGGVGGGVTGVTGGTTFVARVTNGSTGGLLNYAMWAATFELDVGTIT